MKGRKCRGYSIASKYCIAEGPKRLPKSIQEIDFRRDRIGTTVALCAYAHNHISSESKDIRKETLASVKTNLRATQRYIGLFVVYLHSATHSRLVSRGQTLSLAIVQHAGNFYAKFQNRL